MWCFATIRPPISGPLSTCRTRGTEARYVSLLEKDGKMEVVIPYSRTSKVAVMTFRSEADLDALEKQAAQH